MNLEALTAQLKTRSPQRLAIAAAEDDEVLKAAHESLHLGITLPVLIGDTTTIQELARRLSLDLTGMPVIQSEGPIRSAALAVELVRQGEADMLMKGLLQTADLLRAVLHREKGLRTGKTLSHVGAMHCLSTGRTLFITDSAMVMYPDLKTKAELIANAVKMASAMGVKQPKVAAIAAVELVNPDMPPTIDAALLTMMNRRGQIRDCIVDGPLAMDLVLNAEAARHKGVDSPVAGQADILLMPNIEAGNAAMKAMVNMGDCLMGGVVMGARVPIALTSRADSHQSKVYSIACAAAVGACQ
ncbi:bifunctional enoyl-CoA hydratase/phosphate acetyltransferase [Oscillospiraceae bacterium MB08-C2-2]|nr:bifunctional enoyl-CoA hydratase/phosphate acetyltransferase [Oscillospiraceae bacterium MB08-C2-2]